jgi:hypothetical protein
MTEAIGERQFTCPNCGGELAWHPAQKTLVCPSCGTALPPMPQSAIAPTWVEHGLAESLRNTADDHAAVGKVAVQCGNCRAVSYFDRGMAADRCSFCGSAEVVPYDAFHDSFRPESIVPFLVAAEDARGAAVRWIRGQWLAPSKLARLARTDAVKGVYLPFWTFDAHAVAHWDIASGTRGIIEMDFDDLLICGDREADPPLLEQLGPFPAKTLRPYDPRYVAGWTAVRAQRALDEAVTLAHARMEHELAAAAKRDRPAKEREKLKLAVVEYVRETCKQTLLPIWLLDYRYLGKRYRIAVNGATGQAAGYAPKSLLKLTLLGLCACWLYLFFQDPETALEVPLWIAKGLWWAIKRPFGQ